MGFGARGFGGGQAQFDCSIGGLWELIVRVPPSYYYQVAYETDAGQPAGLLNYWAEYDSDGSPPVMYIPPTRELDAVYQNNAAVDLWVMVSVAAMISDVTPFNHTAAIAARIGSADPPDTIVAVAGPSFGITVT